MSAIPANPSAQLRLVLNFFDAANSLDHQRMLSFLSNDHFTHRLLPQKSLQEMGYGTALNKEQLKQVMEGLASILKTPGEVVQEVIEVENKIVVHVKGDGQFVSNEPYAMEYIFIFTFGRNSNGELKIIEIKEFLDSLYFKSFYKSMS